TTLDAYGRSLNDFLAFCQRCEIVPETITREQVALYVQDLAHRPNPKGPKCSLSRVAGAYRTRRCNCASPSCACFVTRWLNDSSARTTRSGVAIMCLVKPLAGCDLVDCSLAIKNCRGSPPMKSGKTC